MKNIKLSVKSSQTICRVIPGRVEMEASYREFLEETANSYCTRADEFNNRANAMMELGRYLEAQRDYNRACNMAPDEPIFFLNRSELFIQLGMMQSALDDAMEARLLIGDGSVKHLDDLLHLARIFKKCNSLNLAAETLLNFLKLSKSLIPYTVKDSDGGYIIRKGSQTVHMSNFVNIDDVKTLLQAIQGDKAREGDMLPGSLIEEIKREVTDCGWLTAKD